jgi:very-short-patch-repair endonuclease
MCTGCATGRVRLTYKEEGWEEKEIRVINGQRFIRTNFQVRRVCNFVDGTCDQQVRHDTINHKIDTYCTRHRGGVLNKRQLPLLEQAMIAYLDKNNIKYIHDSRVYHDPDNPKRFLRPDFQINNFITKTTPTNVIVEVDGAQHFYQTAQFHQNTQTPEQLQEQFQYRNEQDATKDKYARDAGIFLIRIAYCDIKNIPQIMDAAFTKIAATDFTVTTRGSIFATTYYNKYPRYIVDYYIDSLVTAEDIAAIECDPADTNDTELIDAALAADPTA